MFKPKYSIVLICLRVFGRVRLQLVLEHASEGPATEEDGSGEANL